MNKLAINQRFIDAVNFIISSKKVVSKTEIAEKLEIKKSTFSEILNLRMNIGTESLAVFCESFGINATWILTGKGEMQEHPNNIVAIRENTFSLEVQKDESYPIVSIDAIAGFGGGKFSIEKADVVDYCSIPIFKGKKVDFLVPVRGQSMLPKYKTGDLVACAIISDNTFIQWNEIHVIATREQGILLKRLRKSSKENHLEAVSDNPEYSAFDIPHDEITGIALVIGGVSLE